MGFPRNRAIPRAYSSNPGVFAELALPVTPCLDVEVGGRLDLVYINAYPLVDRDLDGIPDDQIYLFATFQTPLPEPSGPTMLLAGVLGLCGLARIKTHRR